MRDSISFTVIEPSGSHNFGITNCPCLFAYALHINAQLYSEANCAG